jgi:hypothetical protein
MLDYLIQETGKVFHFQATVLYANAQHVIFQNNAEKRYLYAGVRRCYGQVIAMAPYRIEHIDIPWNGTFVSGNLHLCPHKTSAPLVFYIPGCDPQGSFAGKPLRHPGEVLYIEPNSAGPNSPTVARKRQWYES